MQSKFMFPDPSFKAFLSYTNPGRESITISDSAATLTEKAFGVKFIHMKSPLDKPDLLNERKSRGHPVAETH